MKNFRILTAIFVLSLAGLGACSPGVDEKNKEAVGTIPPQENEVQQLPSFNMIDANGRQINLASFQGKKVFVNLWATWCPPCRKEIPSIEKLYSQTDKDKAVFVLLSLDENFATAKEFASYNKLQLPIFYPAAPLPELFNVAAIPASYIFNEKGELVKEIKGMDDYSTKEYIEIFR